MLLNHRDFFKMSSKMFDQQMWCWGFDIREPMSNKLVQYGFGKVRISDDLKIPSQYSIIYKNYLIYLWGFGGLISKDKDHALFIKRFDLYPKQLEYIPEDLKICLYKDIEKYFMKDSYRLDNIHYELLAIFYDMIIDYEQWIIKLMGIGYRENTLSSWIKKKIVDAENIIPTWKSLYEYVVTKMIEN